MAAWREVAAAAPELAEAVRAYLDAHVHKTLATLRKDGSPRISGIEASFADGELWFGGLWRSQKALDLQRGSPLRPTQRIGRPTRVDGRREGRRPGGGDHRPGQDRGSARRRRWRCATGARPPVPSRRRGDRDRPRRRARGPSRDQVVARGSWRQAHDAALAPDRDHVFHATSGTGAPGALTGTAGDGSLSRGDAEQARRARPREERPAANASDASATGGALLKRPGSASLISPRRRPAPPRSPRSPARSRRSARRSCRAPARPRS